MTPPRLGESSGGTGRVGGFEFDGVAEGSLDWGITGMDFPVLGSVRDITPSKKKMEAIEI